MIGKIYISGKNNGIYDPSKMAIIGTYGEQKGVDLIDVISQVKNQPNATSFEVYINSEGGVVDTGYDIYNFLKSLGLPVTTIGIGIVASIATVPFMSGSKRIIKPHTKFMIHAPMKTVELANADEMELHTKGLRDVEARLSKFYSDNLNLSKEAISPLMKKDTWISPEQLESLGFTNNNSNLQMVAIVKSNNKPNTIKMSKTNKFQAILNLLKGVVVNKVIYTADSKELVFADLTEDDPIEIGAKATVDGVPAGGTEDEPVSIVGQDGKTYVFVGSAVIEIKEVEEEAEDAFSEEDFVEALVATLEVATDLEKRVEAMEVETVAIKLERDDFKTKLATATETIAKLKGKSESPQEEAKDKDEKKEDVSSTVAQWRKSKQLKKK